jgi:hypothetical protein
VLRQDEFYECHTVRAPPPSRLLPVRVRTRDATGPFSRPKRNARGAVLALPHGCRGKLSLHAAHTRCRNSCSTAPHAHACLRDVEETVLPRPKNGSFGVYPERMDASLPSRWRELTVGAASAAAGSIVSLAGTMTAPLESPSSKAADMGVQSTAPSDCWLQLRNQVTSCHPLVERCYVNVLQGHSPGQCDRVGITRSSLVCVNPRVPPPQLDVEHPLVLLAVSVQGPCGPSVVSEVASMVQAAVAIPHALVLLNGHDLPTWASYSMDKTNCVSVTLPGQPHSQQCWISKKESGCMVMIEPNADLVISVETDERIQTGASLASEDLSTQQPTLSCHTAAGDSIPPIDAPVSADQQLASMVIWPEVALSSFGSAAECIQPSQQYEDLPYVLATLGVPFNDIPSIELESVLIWNSISTPRSSSTKNNQKNNQKQTDDHHANMDSSEIACTSILEEEPGFDTTAIAASFEPADSYTTEVREIPHLEWNSCSLYPKVYSYGQAGLGVDLHAVAVVAGTRRGGLQCYGSDPARALCTEWQCTYPVQ